jgi:hypothetical protein
MAKELLIGCGQDRRKILGSEDGNGQWSTLVTLDINPDNEPDVLWDLTKLPLPFGDGEFAEIHAYEILEHAGARGD